MISSIPSPKRHLFQVNRHVRASIMLLSIMDGAELDLNNTILSSSSKPTTATTTSSSISTSDDYEKDLQLAAELGRCLLERNQELQNYIDILQKQIDDEQCSIKLLHAKLESTREQLDTKCKQTEILDAANFDLERELARQRRDNEINRQRIQELSDLCEKIPLVFKTHLTELKSRINSLTTECSGLNEKLDKSRQEKRYLIGRITLLERQRRDDNDSLQNELNHYKKLLEKYTNDNSNIILSNIYSPPEHEVSLYDEVLLENKQSMNKPSYEPTNYKDLFANVYEKLKISNNNNNNDA
ncbi:unnamed protein product [Rotaria sordida]|uniref:Uncharacterized protein n=1 Tax=Rotaria sordida TaxID=392033 RepID=A0A815AHL8_9BILA|nr:unnamed protein product [Rotaria sordida]CAF1537158.1 unnamed protein product [Rotaria sordida]